MAQRLLMKMQVVDVRDEAVGIKSIALAPTQRDAVPAYPGGAHTIVRLPDGQMRSYSLCGDPRDRSQFRIAVLREPAGRGGSVYLHDALRRGDVLWAMHPQPAFALDATLERHVMIAGGIGVTPFVGMLHDVTSEMDAELHYCVRSEAHAAFLDVLDKLPVRVTLYRGDRGERLPLDHLLARHRADTQVYCCGPERLMSAVRSATSAWPDGTVRFEPFVGVATTETSHGEPFEVELLPSKRWLQVGSDQSLLEAIREAGIPIDWSCEGGICRTCQVELLEGEAIHRDLCLSAEERRHTLLTCVSRGRGVLRLLL